MSEYVRNAWAEVDLAVLRDNAAVLSQTFAPAELCAVVKADGYGHGAVQVAQAAIDGGATWLAVALVEEGRQLRDAGIDVPILLLSEPQPSAMSEVVAFRLTPTVYTRAGIEAAADAVAEQGEHELALHLKIDTGMHRVGAAPEDAVALAQLVGQVAGLRLEGLFTHFAVADEPGNAFTVVQAERFNDVIEELKEAELLPPMVHCCNSAAGLLHRQWRFSMVRCGIALYGIPPSDDVVLPDGVRPVMSVKSDVSYVKRLAAGERISYGQRYELATDSYVATVPLGYADGLPRRWSDVGGEVLIRGMRRMVAGNVTMDQFMVDCGDAPVEVGDEVIVLGRQDDEQITANEMAARLDTIGYEIVCRIGPRLPRHYLGEIHHFL